MFKGVTAKLQSSGSQTVVPRPAASASPGNVLEMGILRSHPRLTRSETLELGPSNLVSTVHPGGSDVH